MALGIPLNAQAIIRLNNPKSDMGFCIFALGIPCLLAITDQTLISNRVKLIIHVDILDNLDTKLVQKSTDIIPD